MALITSSSVALMTSPNVCGITILVSIVVSIPACHAGDPGSIPGREGVFDLVRKLVSGSFSSIWRHSQTLRIIKTTNSW